MGKRKRGGGIAPIHGEWRRRDGQGNWSDEDTWKQRGTAAQNFGAAVGSNRSPHREGKRLKTKALRSHAIAVQGLAMVEMISFVHVA